MPPAPQFTTVVLWRMKVAMAGLVIEVPGPSRTHASDAVGMGTRCTAPASVSTSAHTPVSVCTTRQMSTNRKDSPSDTRGSIASVGRASALRALSVLISLLDQGEAEQSAAVGLAAPDAVEHGGTHRVGVGDGGAALEAHGRVPDLAAAVGGAGVAGVGERLRVGAAQVQAVGGGPGVPPLVGVRSAKRPGVLLRFRWRLFQAEAPGVVLGPAEPFGGAGHDPVADVAALLQPGQEGIEVTCLDVVVSGAEPVEPQRGAALHEQVQTGPGLLDPEQQARLLAGVGDPFLAEVGGEPDQCAVQVPGRAEVGPCLAVPQVGDDLGEPRHAASPAYCPTYAKSFSW